MPRSLLLLRFGSLRERFLDCGSKDRNCSSDEDVFCELSNDMM